MGCIFNKPELEGLPQKDIEFLKRHTHYSETAIREWYKNFRQDCPNGTLSREKFVDMYNLFFHSENAEMFCDHVFRTFDTDQSGSIDFKEFLLAINVTSAGDNEEKVKWAFRMYDVDGDGVIDIQEMTKIVKSIYVMLDRGGNKPVDDVEQTVCKIFMKMDTDADGKLTEGEFLQGCLQDEELAKMLAPNTGIGSNR